MPDIKMQEQRNKKLTLSLLVLIGLVIAFYVFTGRRNQPVADPAMFHADEQAQIDRVSLISQSDTVELRFDGTRWRVNNQYDADRQMINLLFATLEKAVPGRPVAARVQDSIRGILDHHGVTVSLFEKDELKEKFTAGGNGAKTESWFKHAGDIPYVMVIPGYRAYVSYVLELKEDDWRDKRIFNFNWRNFKSLKATTREPGQDFEVVFADRFFTIRDVAGIDTTRLNDFLDAVSLLTADRLSTVRPPSYDSLVMTPPALFFELQDIARQSYALKLWPPLKNERLVIGQTGEGSWVFFAREKIAAVARKKAYFFSQQRP